MLEIQEWVYSFLVHIARISLHDISMGLDKLSTIPIGPEPAPCPAAHRIPEYLKIKRFLNAFMLYRKAFQNRAKERCS